jgi:hypothetical protein
MTIVAAKNAAAAAAAQAVRPVSRLAQARAQAPRGEIVTMPLIGRVWVELVGEAAQDEIDGSVVAILKTEGLDLIPLNARAIERCRNALMLAWAVRSADNKDEKFDSAEAWRTLDADMITACALVYEDVRYRLSPVAMGALTKEQFDEIRLAIEKKNATQLASAGVVALSLYLLSTADQPANSPTTKSSTGESQ